METDFGFPVGTEVIILSEGNMGGVVVGHKYNCFGCPLVCVRDEFRTNDGYLVYYPGELRKA